MQARHLANGAAALVVTAFVAGAVLYSRSLGSQAEVGKPAPAFTLLDLQGRPVALAELRGRPVLVNFWTSWCDPCREEIPGLESFYRRFGSRMPVVGVNVREPAATVRAFAGQMGMTYPVVRDADGRLSERYRLRGYPESWLVDADGVARRYWPGPVTFEQLEQAYADVTGRPITAGLPDGGPLPAGEGGVAVAVAGGRLWVAGRGRLLSAPLSGWQQGGAWQEVGLPSGVSAIDAMAARPGASGVVVASGRRLWSLEAPGAPWEPLAPAPGPVASLGVAGGRLVAWIAGAGPHRLDGGGAWQAVPSAGLPLGAAWGRVVGLGSELAAATPGGLLRSPSAGGGYRPTPIQRPAFAAVAAGSGWWVATDRGIYRLDLARGTAEPAAGAPVRAFVDLAALPDGSLVALAPDGDLYWAPAPGSGVGDGAWRPAPVARADAAG